MGVETWASRHSFQQYGQGRHYMGVIWVFQQLVRIIIWYVPSHPLKCDRGKVDVSTIHQLSFSKILAYLTMDERADWSVTIGFIMPDLSALFASWSELRRFSCLIEYVLKFLIVVHFLTKLKMVDIDGILRWSWGWFSGHVGRRRGVVIVNDFNFFWVNNGWWSRGTIFFYIGWRGQQRGRNRGGSNGCWCIPKASPIICYDGCNTLAESALSKESR